MDERRLGTSHVGTSSIADLLDRVLDGGVAIQGDVIIALAGVDLFRLDLRLALAPMDKLPHEGQ